MDGHYVLGDLLQQNSETHVSVYRATSLLRDGLPVIVKRHNLCTIEDEFLENMAHIVNEGLAHARVEHKHFCKILEVRFDMDLRRNSFSVYHVFEALDRDLAQEIQDRKNSAQPFSEAELRTFLKQTSSALALAHNLVLCTQAIAHRDIKPTNICLDAQGNYKVADFGCFYEHKTSGPPLTVSTVGTISFMNPKERMILAGHPTYYNPFKADVYSLGLTAIRMAFLETQDKAPLLTEQHDDLMRAALQPLSYSQGLKNLLLSMVSFRETRRPDMQTLADQLKRPTAHTLVSLIVDEMHVFDLITGTRDSIPLLQPILVDETSMWAWMKATLFCSGGNSSFEGRNAYKVLQSGTVVRLPDMNIPRKRHGLWWDSRRYKMIVFGGTFYSGEPSASQSTSFTEYVGFKDCEELSQQADLWEILPTMREARSDFTPCEYRDWVYLCGKGAASIEVFHPEACFFHLLQVQQPEAYSACVLVMKDKQLVLLSDSYVTRWTIGKDGEVSPGSQTQLRWQVVLTCNMPPVLHACAGLVYTSYVGKCFCTQLDGSQQTRS